MKIRLLLKILYQMKILIYYIQFKKLLEQSIRINSNLEKNIS